jgi:cation-transporting P-type ATPase I
MLGGVVQSARRITGLAVAAAGAVVAGTPALVGLVPAPGRVVTGVVAGGVSTTCRVVAGAAQAPVRATVMAADLAARQGGSAAVTLSRQTVWLGRALLDAHPRRTRRRVWQGHGHAHIEVRGLTGTPPRVRAVARDVRGALSGLAGVHWAEVNAVTGHVVVAFDEHRIDVGRLLGAVRVAEGAQGTREEGFPWEPIHPSDGTPLAATVVELTADCVACTTAIIGRALGSPALPRGVRVALILADLQPQLRRHLIARIGPVSTDLVMALVYAAVLGLSQRPLGPAIDAIHRGQLVAEALSRRSVWQRREPEVCRTPEALPDQAPGPVPRPGPLPPGPLEAWTELLGPGSLAGAAAVLVSTRDLRRAADTVLAVVPRAARLGRESFAATASRRLARHGIVPLDAAAYRRLDRISAIVLDSEVLCPDRPQILHDQGVDRDLPHRAPVDAELAPLAEALVDAAIETGARVLLTKDAVPAHLMARVNETLPGDQPLASHVRRLQEAGHGVLCVSATAEEALAAADVGVGILGHRPAVPWTADLLCGPGLEGAWRVLLVLAAARPLTKRVVRLAQTASGLGTVLAVVGGRRLGGRYALAPVHAAALVGLFEGARAAHKATRRRPPVPVVPV